MNIEFDKISIWTIEAGLHKNPCKNFIELIQ